MTMIPCWYYLAGLIPLFILLIPGRKSIRLAVVVVSVFVLFCIWGGVSKELAIEKEIGQQSIQALTKTLQVERASFEAKVLSMTAQNKELRAELADANSAVTCLTEEKTVLQEALQTAIDIINRSPKK